MQKDTVVMTPDGVASAVPSAAERMHNSDTPEPPLQRLMTSAFALLNEFSQQQQQLLLSARTTTRATLQQMHATIDNINTHMNKVQAFVIVQEYSAAESNDIRTQIHELNRLAQKANATIAKINKDHRSAETRTTVHGCKQEQEESEESEEESEEENEETNIKSEEDEDEALKNASNNENEDDQDIEIERETSAWDAFGARFEQAAANGRYIDLEGGGDAISAASARTEFARLETPVDPSTIVPGRTITPSHDNTGPLQPLWTLITDTIKLLKDTREALLPLCNNNNNSVSRASSSNGSYAVKELVQKTIRNTQRIQTFVQQNSEAVANCDVARGRIENLNLLVHKANIFINEFNNKKKQGNNRKRGRAASQKTGQENKRR